MSILCVGEAVADIVVRPVPSTDVLPDSTVVEDIDLTNGGDALNVAVGLARQERDVTFVGRIGSDIFGRRIVELAEQAGVDMSRVCRDPQAGTSRVVALIRDDGERNFLHYTGANRLFCRADITPQAMGACTHLHIGGTFHLPSFDGQGTMEALRDARQAGLTTSMDVAYDHSGRWLETIRDCLPYLDYFLPSVGEAACMTGTEDVRAIAERFRSLGVGNVVIKRGGLGVYCAPAAGRPFTCGCYPVDVVDTTGAGDAFVSGFLGALDRGESFEDCVVHGTANAAFAIQKVGATTGVPSIGELKGYIMSRERPEISYE